MSDENKTKFKIDLDTKDALNKSLELKNKISELGDSKNLEGLLEGFLKMGPMVGILGTAFFALKGVIGATFEAESIRAINKEFDILTENAGIATETLKRGLVEASHGLVDDTELMQHANKALVELGVNAKKLPEIMELSRKVAGTFGGELTERFDDISRAVATGNMRILKNIGLNIDADKALRKYAEAHGTVAKALSESERQAALMNAVLEKGNKSFQGNVEDLKVAQNTWKQFKVAMQDISETVVLAMDRMFGEHVKSAIKSLAETAKTWKTHVIAEFGEGSEKSAAKIEELSRIIQQEQKAIDSVNKNSMNLTKETQEAQLDFWSKRQEQHKKELEALTKAEEKKNPEAKSTTTKGADTGPDPDLEKRREENAKFNEDLAKMEQERNKAQQQSTEDLDQFEALHREESLLEWQQYYSKKETIETSHDLTREQKDQEIEQLAMIHNAKLLSMDEGLAKKREAVMQRQVAHSKTAFQGIGNAAKLMSKQATADLNNFGLQGKRVMESYKTHSVNAFLAVGAGQANVGEAMRDVAFNMIADELQARGEGMLLEGLWPPNPIELGAGGGLVALSGLLRSKTTSGGGGGISGGGGGGGSASLQSGIGVESEVATTNVAANAAPKKSVSINVAGSYFETEQTKRSIVQMIQDSSDATDFSFRQIGKV